jgi:hypothetical protein
MKRKKINEIHTESPIKINISLVMPSAISEPISLENYKILWSFQTRQLNQTS